MSFADRVKDAVKTAESEGVTDPARRYHAVLDDLAKGLEALGVGARIVHPPHDARQSTLLVHPQFQPDRGSLILTFRLDRDAMIVSGEEPTRIETPEQLEQWLLEYVKLPAFIESLGILRERAQQPVEARLRVNTLRALAKGDILVTVGPIAQRRIAETPLDAPADLEVERVEFPGNARFTQAMAANYVVLDSAGIRVNVKSVTEEGGKLKIVGHRAV